MKNPHDMDKQTGMMHEQMYKIMDTKNQQERGTLVQARRHMLLQHMSAMKDGGMMGGDAKSGIGTDMGKRLRKV